MNWLIVTAANRAQAHGYRIQLNSRTFPESLRWQVIPDPGGRRVGSGGSTLWVLHRLSKALRQAKPRARTTRELFEGERVLLIHSGGDSRRLPSYAAQGKLFIPLPCSTGNGRPAALFDLILASLQALPAPDGGQVLIASGDVLLTFDPKEVDFNRPGVVGVAYPGPMERGARHGVYVAGRDGAVSDFLQKPDEQMARSRHAVDPAGRVLVDTGLLSLDPATVERWLSLRRVVEDLAAGRCSSIDLYEHILMALVPARGREDYLARVTDPRHKSQAFGVGDPAGIEELQSARVDDPPCSSTGPTKQLLSQLYNAVHGAPFHVSVLPYCDFFHIGSTRELLSNIGMLNRTARAFGFSNFDRSHVAQRASLEGAFVYNSILTSKEISAGEGVFLEAVHTDQKIDLPGPNIVVNWPSQAAAPLQLPAGRCVVCLPIGSDEWATILFDIDDDFKNPPAHWEEKRWPITSRPTLIPPRQSRLYSVRELMRRVNHDRLLAQRAEIQRLSDLHDLSSRLQRDPWYPASRLLALIRTREEARRAQAALDDLIRSTDSLSQTRLYKYAQLVQQRFGAALPSKPRLRGPALERAAFDAVARAVSREVRIPDQPRSAAILPDQVVWVTSPVRIDFAGGWSDTPPVCTELGGSVLNAAITLNGQYPVQVMAKLTEKPAIRLTSLDLGERVEITETPLEAEYRDPGKWYALPKAALMLGGAVPPDPRQKLKSWLGRIGGGLDITVFSALPKGSGLGTSSILGAAMLACIARILGENLAMEELIARTSMLEQIMTTAGGWQDQIGGIVPGVKLIRTDPGPGQMPRLHWVRFDMSPGSPLGARLLLYYTGYKRMAKNILQKVVGRYLARDPEAVSIIHQLKELAEGMERDLGAADAAGFGRGVDRYWELKKQLDPGSTSPQIEALLKSIDRYLECRLLPGAGGGGFIFMMARDEQSARRIREQLQRQRPNRQARFFDWAFDSKGLSVTVF